MYCSICGWEFRGEMVRRNGKTCMVYMQSCECGETEQRDIWGFSEEIEKFFSDIIKAKKGKKKWR